METRYQRCLVELGEGCKVIFCCYYEKERLATCLDVEVHEYDVTGTSCITSTPSCLRRHIYLVKDHNPLIMVRTILLLLLLGPLAVHSYKCQQDSVCSTTSISDVTQCLKYQQLAGNNANVCIKACKKHIATKKTICQDNCPSRRCMECVEAAERSAAECRSFYQKMEGSPSGCDTYERELIKCCSNDAVCKVCRDSYCQNGGVCNGGPNILSCKCPKGFTGMYCQNSQCVGFYRCQNEGKCAGPNTCSCPPEYTGSKCERKRLGTKINPAPNAQAILDAGDSLGSGMYWIQPPGESIAAQTFCDMAYSDGGWMLASYGIVGSSTSSASNKAIPNMNNPMGYAWRPSGRAGGNGVINLSQGAVMMARNATFMIMAAGNNPNNGGIDLYTHVYRIDLRQNPYNITFANHNRFNGAVGANGIPKMHMTDFLVEGLKGDVGEYARYGFGESLGVTWGDSYPTGYGFYDIGIEYGSWDKGPFFPSVHSGDGHASCSSAPCKTFQPDVSRGSESYVHRGWYTASGSVNQIGQTSIWFK